MSMRKKVDPRVIGIFVIGAVMLTVSGLLFFGPGGIFSETRRYVIYFDSSLKGLGVGSPVRFRGVRIGQVKEINIQVRPSDLVFHIPVIIELDPKKIRAEGSGQGLTEILKTSFQTEDPILLLVAQGLRAQLQLDSLVTGQLFVNLDMIPTAPAITIPRSSDYPQIPSVSSGLAELTKTLEEVPLQLLIDKLMQSADGVQRLFTSPALHIAIERLETTTGLINELLTDLNNSVPQLLFKTDNFLDVSRTTVDELNSRIIRVTNDIQQTLIAAQETLVSIDNRIEPLAVVFDQGMRSFDKASTDVSATMQQVKELTGENSPLLHQFSLTLHELNRTLRSLRYLADEIERDPQILLRGRSVEE